MLHSGNHLAVVLVVVDDGVHELLVDCIDLVLSVIVTLDVYYC